MKLKLLGLSLTLLAVGLGVPTVGEQGPAIEQNIILISWDGVQRAHLMELYDRGLLPNLMALAQEGTMMAMEVTDHATDTKAGHSQMLSGYGPDVTGVYSNGRYQAIPDGLTLFERLKETFGPQIATVAITGKRGNIIEILENALPEIDFALIRGATAERNGPIMLRALEVLQDQPFFAFFHLSDPDHTGHAHGENSQEYSEAIEACDRWLGEIVSKLKELGIYEKTLIYVTTDHGFDEGRASHRNAPEIWLVTNDPLARAPEGGVAKQRDVAPTLLERFGFELNSLEPPLPGRSLISEEAAATTVLVERDVVFATVEGIELKLDVYKPELPGPFPAIVFVHGGGWTKGDKRGMEGYARYFAELGYVGFSVNYRLAPEFKFPAQIEDVKCAVRWVREHAADYDIDPERIGALGTSAGGHLVGLLGVTGGSEGLEGACGNPAISSRVQAVAPYFGPMDLNRLFTGTERGAQTALKLLGVTCEADPEVCQKASPISYVSSDDPPFMLVHGTLDPVVPFEQSLLMEQALQSASVEAELVPIEGAGHGWLITSPFGEQALSQVVPFFERHLNEEFRLHLGYATSVDGSHWTKHPGNPVFSPAKQNGIGTPTVLGTADGYEPYGIPAGPFRHAFSADGVHWTVEPGHALARGPAGSWDAAGIFGPTVILDDREYKMWYSGFRVNFDYSVNFGIGYATRLPRSEP